ncbi:response regulator transcription factor [Paenibacillus agaridevorans]|uniref:response regulator transcription factor n=1 Tax=Paenibacillus agaridevorans TaxID=171404 RepID=UPI001BE3E2DE|nr:response regulator [Paenibacillus agaridevorans]
MYRILVVDDEPMIRKGLEKLISQTASAEVIVETAENGADALDRIQANRPDFVFTDIRMPRMDGLELCKHIRENDSSIDVVVVSGYSDFEYAQKCVSYGVKEYILKPVTRHGVAETIGKLIAGMAAKRSIGFIPMAEQEAWIEQLEEAVWHLDESARSVAAGRIRQYCEEQSISAVQLRDMLYEVMLKLVKNLNKRDVYNFPEPAGPEEAEPGLDSSFRWMGAELDDVMKLIRGKRRGNVKDPVEEVKQYIEQNLSKELTLEDVADRLGLNPSYFSQLFKQMTDETFVQYRIKRRMERAKKLLALPHYKITDISHEVGYADHPHFTKTFKRMTGCTPSEYRDMLGID